MEINDGIELYVFGYFEFKRALFLGRAVLTKGHRETHFQNKGRLRRRKEEEKRRAYLPIFL
jgi:hypothetical protein